MDFEYAPGRAVLEGGGLGAKGAHLLPGCLVRSYGGRGKGWLLGLVAHGVVGGPLGLPPPVAFLFCLFLFFVEKKRREKNRDFGAFQF